MANAKVLSLLAIFFIVISNISFAQSSDASSHEGKLIDSSKEDGIIVHSNKMGFEKEKMMERFSKGGISEEDMRAMAKEKLGKEFDEMEFEKEMLESKDRMKRKEAFSYEHQGFEQKSYMGPSYEGYSKEQMIFGVVFEHIGDDIDPREIKQYCNEPEKIADIVIEKFRDKVGDLQKVCSSIDENEARCADSSKTGCLQIGTAFVSEDASEMEKIQAVAYSCPANPDAIMGACRRRSSLYMEQRLQNIDEGCKKRFDFKGDRLLKECERFRESNLCDKEKYMERCMGGIKKEDFEKRNEKSGFMYVNWQCYDGFTESQSDSSCKSSEAWQELAIKSCEGHCYADKSKCGVNSFSVSGECEKVTKPICPTYPVPQCSEGSALHSKVDSNGCTYYYCEKTTTNMCSQDVQQCPDGAYVKRVSPGCNFEACQTTACPGVKAPACSSGQTLQKKTDEKGCVYYYCASQCPSVEKPTCASGGTLQAYYDNAGCATSYQCIRQTACPEVSKPSCAEGQSITTKYDDNGCIVGYECISVTTTTGNAVAITGNVVLNTYDDYLRQCENSWQQQQSTCLNIPKACDKDTFIEKCKEQERKTHGNSVSQIEINCKTQAIAEVKHVEEKCGRIDEDRQRCMEESGKRCGQMKGMAQQCKEQLTEDSLRKFVIGEVKKRCKLADILPDEEDIKKSDKVEIVLAVLNTATKADIEKFELST